jgi:hypothetical protein
LSTLGLKSCHMNQPFLITTPGGRVLTVYIRIKLQVDLQADKSSVVVKGPFFPQV